MNIARHQTQRRFHPARARWSKLGCIIGLIDSVVRYENVGGVHKTEYTDTKCGGSSTLKTNLSLSLFIYLYLPLSLSPSLPLLRSLVSSPPPFDSRFSLFSVHHTAPLSHLLDRFLATQLLIFLLSLFFLPSFWPSFSGSSSYFPLSLWQLNTLRSLVAAASQDPVNLFATKLLPVQSSARRFAL